MKEDALWHALLLRVIDDLRIRQLVDGKEIDNTPPELKCDIENLEKRLYRDVEWEEKGKLTVDLSKLFKGAATGAVQLGIAMLPGFAAEAVRAAQAALGSGKSPEAMFDALERNTIKHHQDQLRSVEQFQQEFGDLISKHVLASGQRLVVFVDDLDRCLPEKAIEVLEAIKLFLDVPGCVFVLGMDRSIVEKGIELRYRHLVPSSASSPSDYPISGDFYLQKMIQLPFHLPPLSIRGVEQYIKDLEANVGSERITEPGPQILALGLPANPRQIKRTLNLFHVLNRIAKLPALRMGS